jgi:hypothetical protein
MADEMNVLLFDLLTFSQQKSLKSSGFLSEKTDDRGILQEHQPGKQPASPNGNEMNKLTNYE